MSLVAATAADVDAIVALVESAFRGDASRAGWTTEADLLDGRRTGSDEIGSIVADPQQVILLARGADGAPEASVNLRRDGATAWLGMLAVKPGLQGGGLGRRMVEGAEAFARERWGARVMRMKVIAQRGELIAWYERRGYRDSGETAAFPYGDARFGLPRRDDLSFVILQKSLV